jgi:hypothetical protein
MTNRIDEQKPVVGVRQYSPDGLKNLLYSKPPFEGEVLAMFSHRTGTAGF